MTQIVTDEQGLTHEFPDEATPDMIARALGVKPPPRGPRIIDPETMTPQERARLPVPSISGAIESASNVARNLGQVPRDIGEGAAEFISRGAEGIGRLTEAATPPGSDARAWAQWQLEMMEAAKQRRKARFEQQKTGTGIGEFGREVVTTTPAMLVPGMTATKLLPRLVAGAAGGATAGALGPTDPTQPYFQQKQEQALTGAGVGAVVPAALATAGRVISPAASTNRNVQTLMREGVTPTPAQMLGGVTRDIEERARGAPIVGTAIKMAQEREYKNLNRTVTNRVLKEIGEQTPEEVEAGRKAVDYVQRRVSSHYDDTLSRTKGEIDREFVNDIARIRAKVPKSLQDDYQNLLQRTLGDRAVGRKWTGDELNKAKSELGAIGKRYSATSLATERDYGEAAFETRNAVMSLIRRQNPSERGRLDAADRAYANLVILELASGAQGATEGLFTGAHLSSAVRAASASASGGRKRKFAAGMARMQDLSDAAKTVLSPRAGDPGTAGTIMSLGLLGGSVYDPMTFIPPIAAGTAASFGLYSKPFQQGLGAIIARRPLGAPAAADQVRNMSPFLVPSSVAINPWETLKKYSPFFIPPYDVAGRD